VASLRFIFAAAVALSASTASAQEVVFKDPTGDDNGPGKYVYPTDPVYKPGSFDLTQLRVKQAGDKVTFEVSVNADLEDPWQMPAPANFSIQMAFIHIKTGKGGHTKGIPGTNVQFAAGDVWLDAAAAVGDHAIDGLDRRLGIAPAQMPAWAFRQAEVHQQRHDTKREAARQCY